MPDGLPPPGAIDLEAHHRQAVQVASDVMACHYILAFCARRGSWAPFTAYEVNAWAVANGWGVPMALCPARLAEFGLAFDGERYTPTPSFVIYCQSQAAAQSPFERPERQGRP